MSSFIINPVGFLRFIKREALWIFLKTICFGSGIITLSGCEEHWVQ